jgi:hypothetical protein
MSRDNHWKREREKKDRLPLSKTTRIEPLWNAH